MRSFAYGCKFGRCYSRLQRQSECQGRSAQGAGAGFLRLRYSAWCRWRRIVRVTAEVDAKLVPWYCCVCSHQVNHSCAFPWISVWILLCRLQHWPLESLDSNGLTVSGATTTAMTFRVRNGRTGPLDEAAIVLASAAQGTPVTCFLISEDAVHVIRSGAGALHHQLMYANGTGAGLVRIPIQWQT